MLGEANIKKSSFLKVILGCLKGLGQRLLGFLRRAWFFLLVGGIAFAFYQRAPVLLVTDEAFDALYGKKRIALKSLETQARLFRPIKQLTIGNEVSPELVSIAIASVAETRTPYCVLVPFRYAEGAGLFAEQAPQIPLAIIGGARTIPSEEKKQIVSVCTDIETDLYRAGLCAGILVKYKLRDSGGDNVLVLQKATLPDPERAAINKGLQESGLPTAQFIMGNANFRDPKFSCAIVLGSANNFLDQRTKIPAVLFSWLNPEYVPSNFKVIFDDSIWALALPAVRAAGAGVDALVPSEIHIASEFILLKETVKELRELTKN